MKIPGLALQLDASAVPWRETSVRGVQWLLLRDALAEEQGAGQDSAVLIRMEPGCGYPAHRHIDVEEVRRSILVLRGVLAVHDLHIWTVGSGMVSLSGHVVAKDGFADGALLREVSDLLARRFQIEHATVQIEPANFEEPNGLCTDR